MSEKWGAPAPSRIREQQDLAERNNQQAEIGRLRVRLERAEKESERLYVLLAGLLLGRHDPMAPHHVGALREHLGYPSDDGLHTIILTGRRTLEQSDSGEK